MRSTRGRDEQDSSTILQRTSGHIFSVNRPGHGAAIDEEACGHAGRFVVLRYYRLCAAGVGDRFPERDLRNAEIAKAKAKCCPRPARPRQPGLPDAERA